MSTYEFPKLEKEKMDGLKALNRNVPEKMKRGNERECIISFCYLTLF